MLELSEMGAHAKLLHEAEIILDERLFPHGYDEEKFRSEFRDAGWNLLKMKRAIRRATNHSLGDPGGDE